jgi:uncharacterized protein
MTDDPIRIGVISDTHGRFDPALRELFAGVARVVHAGDVGSLDVLVALQAIAPVTAVRGNVDASFGVAELPEEAVVAVGAHRLLLGHVGEALLRRHEPAREGFSCVVFGHSHRFLEARRDGVLYLNPGSAGSPRFGLPRSAALLEVSGQGLTVERIDLK